MLGVSDLTYTEKEVQGLPVLKAIKGKFADECLENTDIVVATTVGNEFLNSNISAIRPGTIVLLAHNDCLPIDTKSIEVLKQLKERNIIVVPGQMLTFGGALTSRIEWFWRQNYERKYFNKQLAHDAVYQMMWNTMEKYYSPKYQGIPFERIVKNVF